MNRNIINGQGWALSTDDNFDSIISEVNALPIEAVLGHYGVEAVRYTGSRILSLCPFHMDEHIGSFSMDTEKNTCWCYACNNGGNAISAMKKVWNKSYTETLLQIAADFDLIDAKTYSDLIGSEYERQGKAREVETPRTKKRPSNETLVMWTRVYEFIRDWFGLLDEDEEYLKTVRKIPEENLKNYFSLTTTDPRIVSRLVFDLKTTFPEYKEEIATIPGFFEVKARDDKWQITMFENDAIAILLRNAEGQVVAVQLRDKNGEAKIRYKYLSHKVPKKNKYMRGGNTVGTPIDVVFPKRPNGKVAIVEGHFKAEILAQEGFVALSVQGVQNFKGIEKDIKAIEAKLNVFLKKVFVFYDGDQLRNGSVYGAGIKLGYYLKEKAKKEPVFVMWDPSRGKGIDDLILCGGKKNVKCVSLIEYETVFNRAYKIAEEKSGIYGKYISAITKAERTHFYDVFETETKKALNL